MRVLVTGGSGFIGGHVVDALLSAGHDVTALVRTTSDVDHLVAVGARLASGDVTDVRSLDAACAGADCVVHTAALVGSYGGWERYRRVGVGGTHNIVDAAARSRVDRFVHVGSIAVYGFRHPSGVIFTEDMPYDDRPEPWNHYVREKVLAERAVWEAHRVGRLRVTSLRPSIVLGVRDRNVVGRMIRILRSPLGGLVGLGRNRVACVVVDELAALVARVVSSDVAWGRAYNVSGKRIITQKQLTSAFARAANLRLLPWHAPLRAAMAWSAALENAYRLGRREQEPYVTRLGVSLFGRDYRVDCSRAANDLGWSGLADYGVAIRDSVQWYLRGAGR